MINNLRPSLIPNSGSVAHNRLAVGTQRLREFTRLKHNYQ